MIAASGYDVDIEVDGGISAATVGGAVRAGANVLVAGSALYRHPDGLAAAVAELRAAAESA
jgi:ribulose-phosphate 3-epimerase